MICSMICQLDSMIKHQRIHSEEKLFDLQALIDHTFAWEPLINENQFACDQCQTKQDGSPSNVSYITSKLFNFTSQTFCT